LGQVNDYFAGSSPYSNQEIIDKIAGKSYLPMNNTLLDLLEEYDEFRVSLSITGVVLEQFQKFAPDVLDSFKKLVDTGKVEILSETYYHSLASIYSLREFCEQIIAHRNLIKSVFDYETSAFRNTELIYNNHIASVIKELGFEVIIAEGWDKYLGWKNSNFVYSPDTFDLSDEEIKLIKKYRIKNKIDKNIKLLLKNYKLSDDVAFRFSNRGWKEYPLTTDKYVKWLQETPGEIINLFMDYETFGEHQWEDTGIFEFMRDLPEKTRKANIGYKTISEAATSNSVDKVSFEEITSWADLERDISAWRGNKMQEAALERIYSLETELQEKLARLKNKTKRKTYIDEWRRLQVSDHFYYMSTKYWSDGDVHKYFSPYDSPYEAFINYMNILEDFTQRIEFESRVKNNNM
jgi:alpha-amylase